MEQKHEKQTFWFEHLRAWSVSGLAQADYCRRHQLAVSRFRYWCRRQRVLAGEAAGDLHLVPVRVSANAAAPALTLRGDAWSLQLPAGTSSAWLADLLRALS